MSVWQIQLKHLGFFPRTQFSPQAAGIVLQSGIDYRKCKELTTSSTKTLQVPSLIGKDLKLLQNNKQTQNSYCRFYSAQKTNLFHDSLRGLLLLFLRSRCSPVAIPQ